MNWHKKWLQAPARGYGKNVENGKVNGGERLLYGARRGESEDYPRGAAAPADVTHLVQEMPV